MQMIGCSSMQMGIQAHFNVLPQYEKTNKEDASSSPPQLSL